MLDPDPYCFCLDPDPYQSSPWIRIWIRNEFFHILDPDPYQNDTDPQHCVCVWYLRRACGAAGVGQSNNVIVGITTPKTTEKLSFNSRKKSRKNMPKRAVLDVTFVVQCKMHLYFKLNFLFVKAFTIFPRFHFLITKAPFLPFLGLCNKKMFSKNDSLEKTHLVSTPVFLHNNILKHTEKR